MEYFNFCATILKLNQSNQRLESCIQVEAITEANKLHNKVKVLSFCQRRIQQFSLESLK